MKKLLLFVFLIVNIFALESGEYICAGMEVEKGDLKYKIPKDKMETVSFKINDNGELISKDEVYKYVITYKKIDVYKNSKNGLKMFVPSDAIEKNDYFKAAILKDGITIYLGCKRVK